MMSAPEIRRVEPADLDAVWALHNEALEAAGAHGGNGPWDDDVRDPIAYYVVAGGEFLVAIASEAVVGMAAVRRVDSRTFELKRMRVHPSVQRKGLGTRLLKALERAAVEHGATRLILDTTTLQTAARRFYEHHAYAELGRSHSGRFELVHYEKVLSAD